MRRALARDHHDDQGPTKPSHRRWPMNVDLARIQFAFTSVNHFFFVPVTIGLAFLTALLQTAWYRTKQDDYQAWTYYVFRRRISRSEFQPVPKPRTPSRADHPSQTAYTR